MTFFQNALSQSLSIIISLSNSMSSAFMSIQIVSCAKFFLTIVTSEAQRHVGLNMVPHGLFCSVRSFAAKSAGKLAVPFLDQVLVHRNIGV